MTGKTVLIVDDEAPIREMIAVALEMADYDYLEAEDAREAHALIVDKQPDLILLDWMLPGTSGVVRRNTAFSLATSSLGESGLVM